MAATTAHINSLDKLFKLFQYGQFTGFVLKDGNENHIHTHGKDEASSNEQALQALQEVFESYDNGRFIVEGKKGFENADAKKAVRWSVSLAPAGSASINGPVLQSGKAFEYMELYFAEKLENSLLKKEIEQLKGGTGITGSPAVDKILESLAPAVPAIIGHLMGGSKVPAPPAMAGPAQPLTDSQQQQIENSICVLLEIDPDFGEKLEKIAAYAQSNPERFKSGFATILNMLV